MGLQKVFAAGETKTVHELSIAIRMVETLEGALRENEAEDQVVSQVWVRVGAMAGVVPEALSFAWGPATEGTLLAGSKLNIEFIPAWINCPNCGEVQLPGIQSMRCPICTEPAHELIKGRELEICSMEVQHAHTTSPRKQSGSRQEESAA